MNTIEKIKQRAKSNIKKIILPETDDIRVLEAASKTQKEGFAEVILIGKEEQINLLSSKNNIDLTSIKT